MKKKLIAISLSISLIFSASLNANELATRLANGMESWKKAGANGKWWSCGKVQEDSTSIANEIAELIVKASEENALNPWGLAGVFAKESKFDECAIGQKTRKWAYANGKLTPSKLTISHTASDVLAVISSSSWKKEIGKADMGLPQVMYPTVYRGDPQLILTREFGIMFAAKEMARRAKALSEFVRVALARPWGLWPGSYSGTYDKSIVAHARALGATKEDLADLPKGHLLKMRHTILVR